MPSLPPTRPSTVAACDAAPVSCTIAEPLASIVLQRPRAHNALDAATIAALTQAIATLPPSVRVVVLRGAGKSFCAGADLHDMQRSANQSPEANRAAAAALSQLFDVVAKAPQVTVAQVHGAVLGGGAGLVSCCDLVVSDSAARFGFPEARLGLAPAVIAPHVLRRIGVSAAKRLFLTADIIDAPTALAIGLIDAVVPTDAIEATVAAWRTSVLRNGPQALARIKALLAQLPDVCAQAGAQLCIDTISDMRVSGEAQAGLQAFLHEHQPPWVLS